MFMLALGGFILLFVRARDYRYYLYAVVARSFIILVLTPSTSGRATLVPRIGCDRLDRLLPSIYVVVQSARASRPM